MSATTFFPLVLVVLRCPVWQDNHFLVFMRVWAGACPACPACCTLAYIEKIKSWLFLLKKWLSFLPSNLLIISLLNGLKGVSKRCDSLCLKSAIDHERFAIFKGFIQKVLKMGCFSPLKPAIDHERFSIFETDFF